jgi:hypothetical protein
MHERERKLGNDLEKRGRCIVVDERKIEFFCSCGDVRYVYCPQVFSFLYFDFSLLFHAFYNNAKIILGLMRKNPWQARNNLSSLGALSCSRLVLGWLALGLSCLGLGLACLGLGLSWLVLSCLVLSCLALLCLVLVLQRLLVLLFALMLVFFFFLSLKLISVSTCLSSNF